jgi:hypothetical protein
MPNCPVITLATIQTCNLIWLACLGECWVGIVGQVCSTKVLCGHGEDTMASTKKQLAAVGLPTPTSQCKLMALVGLLPPSHYKSVLVNFSHALFFRLSTHTELTMQALVWIHIIQFSSSYTNLRYLSTKLKEKTSSCIQVNMVVQQLFMWVNFHKHCRS